ncbi:hypothetical protein DMN91_012974 [Ooceraea biroi]|uniref:CCHC-type domain-containing protein n=1 Tax=Ooceraea biroi TaxID=2015173 RepID=A0A3L8D3K2_OOCBI|nr:branchpoint-bridging protein-like [Ooceraea biroi]RLU15087.1 hypothetical protein DMN91_012974 [Ooceraea biroi]
MLLEPRPLQCYKCLEVGHVQQRCPNQTNRGDRCYRCGGTGHGARNCPAEAPHCPLCTDLGRPAGHRLGGPACARNHSGRKNKWGRAAVEGSGTPSAPVTPTPQPQHPSTQADERGAAPEETPKEQRLPKRPRADPRAIGGAKATAGGVASPAPTPTSEKTGEKGSSPPPTEGAAFGAHDAAPPTEKADLEEVVMADQ